MYDHHHPSHIHPLLSWSPQSPVVTFGCWNVRHWWNISSQVFPPVVGDCFTLNGDCSLTLDTVSPVKTGRRDLTFRNISPMTNVHLLHICFTFALHLIYICFTGRTSLFVTFPQWQRYIFKYLNTLNGEWFTHLDTVSKTHSWSHFPNDKGTFAPPQWSTPFPFLPLNLC